MGVAGTAMRRGARSAGGEPAGLRDAVERFGRLVAARDMAVVGAFAADGMLVGSEPGEVARGHAELTPFFARLFALPVRVRWEWETVDLRAEGDIGWVFAEGHAILAGADGERRLPYRLGAVLHQVGGTWTWRLFHGSEPKV